MSMKQGKGSGPGSGGKGKAGGKPFPPFGGKGGKSKVKSGGKKK